MNNWDYALTSPGYPWRSAMSLPREVSLTDTGDRLELTQQVVDTVGDYQRDDEEVTIGGPFGAGRPAGTGCLR